MNNLSIKYENLKNFLKKNFFFLFYDFKKINSSLINLIKSKFEINCYFLNKKLLFYFNFKCKKNLHLIIIKNEFLLKNLIIFIDNLLNLKPFLISTKNIFINKIPITEISKLSKENLILEFLNFFKIKLTKLINLFKSYGKVISR